MKIKKSPLKTANITKTQVFVFNNVYWIWFKFTKNRNEVSDSWRSGMRSCWHAGGERFKPVYRFFFTANPWMRWKKDISALKTANLKISPLKKANLTKNSMLSPPSSQKDAGALWWNFFFHRYSPPLLHYFFDKTLTRDLIINYCHRLNNWINWCPKE